MLPLVVRTDAHISREEGYSHMRRVRGVVLHFIKSRWSKLTSEDLRFRLTNVNFALSLISLVLLLVLTWYLRMIDDLWSQVALTILYSLIPLVLVFSPTPDPSEALKTRWCLSGFVVFLVFALLIALSARLDGSYLGLNVTMAIVSIPFITGCFWLASNRPLLLVPSLPSGILSMFYFNTTLFPPELRVKYLLTPLPVVVMCIALWTMVGWFFLDATDRLDDRRIWGPAMKSFTMIFLFAPIILLAIWVPQQLSGSDSWSTVLGTFLSVILGGVISEPVRHFLDDLNDVSSRRRKKRLPSTHN